jgi:hypothetical protein
MGLTSTRNGAVSPLTVRSISPVGWRSGAVSPVAARSSSPSVGQQYRNSPLSPLTNGANGTLTPQAISAQKAAARRTIAGLSLDTQMKAEQPQRPKTSMSLEDEEAMDEVISLSPAVRAPVMKFRRQSSGLAYNALATPHPENSLDTVMENDKPYFGQDVDAEDLVAVNLENAFDRL